MPQAGARDHREADCGRQRPDLPSLMGTWACCSPDAWHTSPNDSVLSILTKNMLFGVGGTSLEPTLTGECHKCFEALLNVRGLHSQSAQWELCVSLMVSSRYLRASMLALAPPLSALGNMTPCTLITVSVEGLGLWTRLAKWLKTLSAPSWF